MTDKVLREKVKEANYRLQNLCKTEADFDALMTFTQYLSELSFRDGEDYMYFHKSWKEIDEQ